MTFDLSTTRGKLSTAACFVVGIPVVWAVAAAVLRGGAPPGEVFEGLVLGGLQSLVAMGLIIVYRSIRVINFAQSALGAVAASLAVVLVLGEHWNYWLAVPLGIAAAVLCGFLADLLIQWRFADAPRLIVTVATIGIAGVLGVLAVELPTRFHLSAFTGFKSPINNVHFSIRPLTFTANYAVPLVVVPVALGVLYWFFVRTDTGVAIRGAADSAEKAQLLGIPVRNLTRIAWLVAGGLAGVAAILTEPINGTGGVGQFQLALTMLAPLAAFVLAGMDSFPMAVVWSLVIGVMQQVVFADYGTYVYSQVALFVLILVGLLFQRSRETRVTDQGLGDYVAIREVAPLPRTVNALREIHAGRVLLLGVIAALAIAVPWLTGAAHTSAAVTAVVYAVIAVSMVILVGWAGQISLGQYAIAGLGAAFAGAVMVHFDLPFLAAIAVAGGAGAAVAVLIGLPALRLEGTALAVVTLAFAVVMSTYVLSSQYLSWLDQTKTPVPTLLGRFSLGPPYTALYEFSLFLLALAILAAVALRRSRTGRAVLAVRDNARAASAYAISPLKTKLLAFGISGFIAGTAGAILIVHEGGISARAFNATESIAVFIMVVVGGLGSVTGGVMGALLYTVAATELPQPWPLLATGAGVLVVLVLFPEGIGGLWFKGRDWVAKQVARSKGFDEYGEPLGLPALTPAFGADVDEPDALAHTAALRLGALEDLELHGLQEGTGAVDAGPPDDEPAVLSVEDVDAAYGNAQVLFQVALGVSQREVVALLGTNGAGKTTVLRTVAGLLAPRRGRIRYLGRDITGLSAQARVGGA